MIRFLLIFFALTAVLNETVSARDILISDAILFTPGGQSGPTDILIQGGKIVQLGKGLETTANTEVMDATGKVVTSGFVLAGTSLGAVELAGRANANDASGGSGKLGAGVDISFAINGNSTLLPVARKGGITHAVVLPGIGAPGTDGIRFGGQAALISTRADGQVLVKPKVAVTLDLTKVKARRGAFFPMLASKLKAAANYAARAGSGGSKAPDMDALVPVMKGEVPLIVVVHRKSDITSLLRIVEPYDVDLIIYGGAEAWMVADELARAEVSVLVEAIENRPRDLSRMGATLENAALLSKAGVQIALVAPYSGHDAQLLRYHAGVAVAHGLPIGEAIKAITVTPARMFNVADFGELSVGQQADLLIWSGDPFQPLTTLHRMFIAGDEQSLITRQDQLREKYRQGGTK